MSSKVTRTFGTNETPSHLCCFVLHFRQFNKFKPKGVVQYILTKPWKNSLLLDDLFISQHNLPSLMHFAHKVNFQKVLTSKFLFSFNNGTVVQKKIFPTSHQYEVSY